MRKNESTLTEATAALGAVAARMYDEHVLHDAADADVLSVLASAGEAVRIAEAVLVAAVAQVMTRSPKTAAKATDTNRSPVTGVHLPAKLPQLRETLRDAPGEG